MKAEEKTSDLLPFAKRVSGLVDPAHLDYAVGFAIGAVFSIFSFYFLSLFKRRRHKRLGMFWGCMFSFAAITAASISFVCYSAYLQSAGRSNKLNRAKHRKLVAVDSFGRYMRNSIAGLFHFSAADAAPAESPKPAARKLRAGRKKRAAKAKKQAKAAKRRGRAKAAKKNAKKAKSRKAKSTSSNRKVMHSRSGKRHLVL